MFSFNLVKKKVLQFCQDIHFSFQFFKFFFTSIIAVFVDFIICSLRVLEGKVVSWSHSKIKQKTGLSQSLIRHLGYTPTGLKLSHAAQKNCCCTITEIFFSKNENKKKLDLLVLPRLKANVLDFTRIRSNVLKPTINPEVPSSNPQLPWNLTRVIDMCFLSVFKQKIKYQVYAHIYIKQDKCRFIHEKHSQDL